MGVSADAVVAASPGWRQGTLPFLERTPGGIGEGFALECGGLPPLLRLQRLHIIVRFFVPYVSSGAYTVKAGASSRTPKGNSSLP
jgi:hypothetical protein